MGNKHIAVRARLSVSGENHWFLTDEGWRFNVKRMQVQPGASLSLQKHHPRAEHWIVVTGTPAITYGSRFSTPTENQSTYIPLSEMHRLANPGSIPLKTLRYSLAVTCVKTAL